MKKSSNEIYTLIRSLNKTLILNILKKTRKNTIEYNLIRYTYFRKNINEEKLLKLIPNLTSYTLRHHKQAIYDIIFETYIEHLIKNKHFLHGIYIIKLVRENGLLKKAESLLKYYIKKNDYYGNFIHLIELNFEYQNLLLLKRNHHLYEKLMQNQKSFINTLHKNHILLLKLKEFHAELHDMNLIDGCFPSNKKIYRVTSIIRFCKPLIKNINKLHHLLQLYINFVMSESYLFKNIYPLAEKFYVAFLNLLIKYKDVPEPEFVIYALNRGLAVSIFNRNLNLLNRVNNFYKSLAKDKLWKNYTNSSKILNNEISYYSHIYDFDTAIKKSEKLLNLLNEKNIEAETLKVLYSNLCQCYLCKGEAKSALKYYNQLLDKKFVNVRKDIDAGMDILSLAIYYDLNYFDLMNNNLRYFTKKYNENKSDYPLAYKILLEGFSTLNQIKKENEATLKNILKNIQKCKKNERKSSFFLENTFIEYWLMAKLK